MQFKSVLNDWKTKFSECKGNERICKRMPDELANFTWSRAGPKMGTIKPWYMKSSNCCLIRSWATWTTALQNSRQFIKSVSFGISATSSGVMRYQSGWLMSKLFGSDEYKPPNPVTSTGHIDEYLAMYVPTFEFFCDNDIHSSNASRAWWPREPSLCTYGNSNENIMKLQ